MLIAVGSSKGSPGATTFALALAARWPTPVVLVEADPAGGDLGARCGVPDDPGVASLVLAARRGEVQLSDHAQRLGAGVDVVVGPASAARAAATVAALAPAALSTAGVDVLVDVGRIGDDSTAGALIAAADRIVMVCRGDLPGIDHTAASTHTLTAPHRAGVVVVGASPYRLPELTHLFGVPVLVQAPIDHRGVAALTGARRPRRGWHRIGLPAAARTVALDLHPPSHPTPPSSPHQPQPTEVSTVDERGNA